ncbi:MAG: hypothetical protein H0T60_06995 [Acidobacteria bacterium]|nr:hypothetical protein [Acidobacteriota bacterium]
MFKRIMSLALVALLFGVAAPAPVHAASKAEKQARFAEKVKAGVNKIGTGTEARVEVKLRDKTKLKGYVAGADADGFSVVDAKTGTATRVTYGQVQKVKGHNLSTGAKIAIGLGAAVAVLVILLVLENYG